VTAAGGVKGHAVGLDGRAVGLKGHAAGLNGRAVGLKGHAFRRAACDLLVAGASAPEASH
jgi:hypothetical protein